MGLTSAEMARSCIRSGRRYQAQRTYASRETETFKRTRVEAIVLIYESTSPLQNGLV